jgi:membrane associated rhomboid family serine protease
MSGAGTEVDASVCYRHPDRTSWTLCERCGRTICPECQILTPQGVRCPTCIEELGGSVQWSPAAAPRPAAAAKKARQRRARARSTTLDDRPGWQRVLLEMLRPGGETPVLTWGAGAVTVLLWIPGTFTGILPQWLMVRPDQPYWQVWRFVTTAFVYPPGWISILSVLLGVLFLALNGPAIERMLGRARFAALFVASSAMAAAWMAIPGVPEYGLFAPIIGMLGCSLVLLWDSPPARTQMLVSLAFIVVLNLLLSFWNIFSIIGAFGAGAGAMLLYRRFGDRGATRAYLIMAAGVAVFVVFAIVRQLATGLAR